MDFTPELSAFQGVIISADSVHSFSKLKARGGNEDKIEFVLETIRNFFRKENYIIEDKIPEEVVHTLRKFAYYIVLNSDLTILEEMVDLDGIDFVIWTIPTIPKCLMCEILWKLNLEQFLSETIIFSCPQLSSEVADAVIDNFKYFNPNECLLKLKLLTTACYKLISRLMFFRFEKDDVTYAFNNFQRCLKYYTELPNSGKLDGLSRDEQYKFIGKRLYSMLLLVFDCFRCYITEQKFKSCNFQNIYELTYKEEIIKNDLASVKMTECSDNFLMECINNCNIALLDKCKNLVMDVSVEIYCSWSEFEENGKSMQQTIGELCYKVYTALDGISSISDHPVIPMLQQISCKPIDLVEVINKTEIADIINTINKQDDEASEWLKAFICTDKLFEAESLIECTANNLKLLSNDEIAKLFKIIHHYLNNSNNDKNKEQLLLLAIKLFKHCSSDIKYDILSEQFSNLTFTNSLQTSDFSNMVTEIFNKLIVTPDVHDFSDILTIFIQNPKEVLVKVFSLASENVQQTDIMSKVIKYLEKYSNHYYSQETEPTIMLVTKEIMTNSLDTEKKQNNFVRFLSNIKKASIITGPKLLLLIIMPMLHSGLLNKNIKSICIQCKLLQEAYTLNELIEYRAPTLAMLAQVLDVVRWKINSFDSLAPSTLELVIQLQTSLLNTYESNIPEKESTWLKSKLRNMNPLNMYYFRRLWNPPGNTFVEVISGIHIHEDMDVEHLKLWLSQVLSSTVLQEWYQIWDSLILFGNTKTLDIFHDALTLITVAEKSNCTESTKACLLHILKNFVATTRYKFFKIPLIDSQILLVFNKFVIIENLISENYIEDLEAVFLPLFAYIAENRNELSEEMLINFISKLKNKRMIDVIKKLYTKESDK